jgi:hypothetical protein
VSQPGDFCDQYECFFGTVFAAEVNRTLDGASNILIKRFSTILQELIKD